MGHFLFPEPTLGLKYSRTCPDGTGFSFALENPDRLLVGRAVRSKDVTYEGHAWNVACKRQHDGKFVIQVGLVFHNTDSCPTCTVDFTLSILRRREGSTPVPTCRVKKQEFTKLQPHHEVSDMVSFQALIDPTEGYFSSNSPWVELDLVMANCVSTFECDANIRPVVNGEARVVEFNLADCQLSVYLDMKQPKNRRICIKGQSQVPNQDYLLQIAYKFTLADTVLMSTNLTKLHAQSHHGPLYGNAPSHIYEATQESEGKVTVRIEIASFKLATNVLLAMPPKTGIKGPQGSFQDPLGNSWKMYTQKQNGKISVKLSLFRLGASQRRLHHEDCTAFLQWRARLVPKNKKTDPVPFNEDTDMFESFFKRKSSLLEYTMTSSLEATHVYGHSDPFRHGKKPKLVVRIEYINLQPSVLVPDGKFLMDCELSKMNLRAERDKFQLALNNEQDAFSKYRQACKELEQHEENIQLFRTELSSTPGENQWSECESRKSPSTESNSLILQEDILPGRNGSGEVEVSSPTSTSSSIQDEIEHEKTQIKCLIEERKKIETESKTRPKSACPRCHWRRPRGIISVQKLDEVAAQLGKGWESLGRQHLGLEQTDIERCKTDHPNSVHEQIFTMLYLWRSRKGMEATEEALLAKLKEAKMNPGAILLFHYLSD